MCLLYEYRHYTTSIWRIAFALGETPPMGGSRAVRQDASFFSVLTGYLLPDWTFIITLHLPCSAPFSRSLCVTANRLW